MADIVRTLYSRRQFIRQSFLAGAGLSVINPLFIFSQSNKSIIMKYALLCIRRIGATFRHRNNDYSPHTPSPSIYRQSKQGIDRYRRGNRKT